VRENYELAVTEVVKPALGGDPPLGTPGKVKARVVKDPSGEKERIAEMIREAHSLGWRLDADEESAGRWQAWGTGLTSISATDLAVGASKLEAIERGLSVIRQKVEEAKTEPKV